MKGWEKYEVQAANTAGPGPDHAGYRWPEPGQGPGTLQLFFELVPDR